MSQYNFLTNNYNFQPNIASQTTTNYFGKQITEGLPFFQQNKLQSTLRNNYFNDVDTTLKNGNNKIVTSNEKIDRSDIEAKKIIEREMNPYLSYMKKELNLVVEKFNKNIDEKNDIINKCYSLEKETEEMKTQNEIIKNNLEQKILKNNDILNMQDKRINNMQLDINKFNQLFSMQLNQKEELPTIINDISQIKDKINFLDKNNEYITTQLQQFTENIISKKFNEYMINIKSIKDENEELKNRIEELNNIVAKIKFDNDNKKEENMYQNNNNDEIKKIINQFKTDLFNKNERIQIMENGYDNLNRKILEEDQKIEEALSNINTEHSSIITVAKSMQNNNKKLDYLENKLNNGFYNKEYIDIKIESIDNLINTQNEKVKQNISYMNDNFINKNHYLDLLKKLEDNKKNFENHYDEIDGYINSINNNINDLKTTIKTHPVLNMNQNEIITQKFKENQVKSNEIFRQNIEQMKDEITKLIKNSKEIDIIKNNIYICKNNFENIEEELKSYKEFSKNNENDKKNYEQFKKDVQNQFNDNIKEKEELNDLIKQQIDDLNNKISCLEAQISINSGLQSNAQDNNINLEQINHIQNDMKKLENEINNIKEQKIPEILSIIQDSIKAQKLSQTPNELNINKNQDTDGLMPFSRRGGAKSQISIKSNINVKKEIQNNETINENDNNKKNDFMNQVKMFMKTNKNEFENNNYNNNYDNNENYDNNNNDNYDNYGNNNNNDNNNNFDNNGNYDNNNNNNNDIYNNDYNNGYSNNNENDWNNSHNNGNEYDQYNNNYSKYGINESNNNSKLKGVDELIDNVLNNNNDQDNFGDW